jgi:hypothetical protein
MSVALLLAMLFMNKIDLKAQAAKAASEVKTHLGAQDFTQTRETIEAYLQKEKNLGPMLQAVQPFYGDTLRDTRLEAYGLTYKIGQKSGVLETRQQAVGQLLQAMNDPSATVQDWAASRLSVFNREDFSDAAKKQIVQGIQTLYDKADLIKMAGYLHLKEAESTLQNMATTSRITSERWAADLALARMGTPGYDTRAANLVRKQGLNNDVVYELIPGLIYTRQKACIDYVIETLYNDEKSCISSDPDNPKPMQCGYRVMEMLAPVIKDFPLGIKTSGDIDTDNYQEALAQAREWFLQKGSSYEIIDESY